MTEAPGEQRSIPLRIGTERVGAQADAPAIDRHRDVHVLVGIDPDNHRLRFVQVRHAVRHCRLLGLRRWLVRAGGQDCDGPFVRQAPIGSRPIRSASYQMIRRWAMTDRSKRGHEVSQLEGQAITHRHPPVSPSDTDRRENDAHSQVVERPAARRAAGPATGSRPPLRRGRSLSACVVNGCLRHTVEGAGRHAPGGLHGRMASVIACGDVADVRSGRTAAKLAYGASETRRTEGNTSRRSDQRLVVAKSHRRRRCVGGDDGLPVVAAGDFNSRSRTMGS